MGTPCRAWKAFAGCALPLIPVLIRQMTAVTEQTEEAALKFMTALQAIARRASRQAEDAVQIAGQACARDTDETQMEQAQASMRLSKQQAKELTNDVGQIVMALQFQDITRQKLEHVEQALTHLRDHLQHLVDGKPDADLQDSLSLLKTLEHSYTMEAERQVHAAANGHNVSAHADDGEDSVAMF